MDILPLEQDMTEGAHDDEVVQVNIKVTTLKTHPSSLNWLFPEGVRDPAGAELLPGAGGGAGERHPGGHREGPAPGQQQHRGHRQHLLSSQGEGGHRGLQPAQRQPGHDVVQPGHRVSQ